MVIAALCAIALSLFTLAGCAAQRDAEASIPSPSTGQTSIGILSLQSLRKEGKYPDKEFLPFSEPTKTEFGLLGSVDVALEFLDGIPFMLPKPIMDSLLASSNEEMIRFDFHSDGSKSVQVCTPEYAPLNISFAVNSDGNPVVYPAHKEALDYPGTHYLFSVQNDSYTFDVYESKNLWPDGFFFFGWIVMDSIELFEQTQPVHILLISNSFTAALGYVPHPGHITKETRDAFLSPDNWVVLEQ